MTSEEIRAEISLQLSVLYEHGNVRVVFGWPDKPAEPGIRLETHCDIALDFTVTRAPEPETGFVVFVNRIGNWGVLDALPRGEVVGDQRIPQDVFLFADKFVADYNNGDAVVRNYSLYTELAQQLRPKRIYEIGVRAGYSAWSMLRGAPEASYHGLDLNQGTAGGCVGYIDHARWMLPRAYPDAAITVETGDSQALDRLQGRYDLIHIDGDHGHDETLHDLVLAAHHADYVLIDDVTHIATVGSAVTEFLERYGVPATYYDTWRGHVLLVTAGVA